MLDQLSKNYYADAAQHLDDANALHNHHILAGFDAFIDRICHAVDQRTAPGPDSYSRIASLKSFSNRIAQASGQNANFELVAHTTKPGGNSLLNAHALATLGTTVDFVGLLADPAHPNTIHPILQPVTNLFHSSAPLGPPGNTDAIEFDDGKLMLGNPSPLDTLTVDSIFNNSPYQSILNNAHALVFGNWAMHHALTDLWLQLTNNILPSQTTKPQHCFVDLADISRRSDRDILVALQALAALHAHIPTTLSLNAAEATHLLQLIKQPAKNPIDASTSLQSLQHAALTIHDKLSLCRIIIHTHTAAASATQSCQSHCATLHNPSPKISTGAGDNFNAGCLLGILLNTPEPTSLALGNALASFYVRAGTPPTLEQLREHIKTIAKST